jgi:hypothetical protein
MTVDAFPGPAGRFVREGLELKAFIGVACCQRSRPTEELKSLDLPEWRDVRFRRLLRPAHDEALLVELLRDAALQDRRGGFLPHRLSGPAKGLQIQTIQSPFQGRRRLQAVGELLSLKRWFQSVSSHFFPDHGVSTRAVPLVITQRAMKGSTLPKKKNRCGLPVRTTSYQQVRALNDQDTYPRDTLMSACGTKRKSEAPAPFVRWTAQSGRLVN